MATAIKTNSFQFDWPVRVYYEDTDAGGVVYHSTYLNYMERARTEWLRHLGFEQTYLKEHLNIIFMVHSMQIAFRKPAKFNDLLIVTSELSRIGHCSFEFMQKICFNQQMLIEAQVKIVCVQVFNFKPTAIPEKIRIVMKKYDKAEKYDSSE